MFAISSHPPAPRAHRRFRLVVGILTLGVLGLLGLQYTPHKLLPQHRTATLWGVLVGMVAMTILAERYWAAVAQGERANAR
jgi:hypothetical protein